MSAEYWEDSKLTSQNEGEMPTGNEAEDTSTKNLRSFVWNHCTKISCETSRCNICNGEFKTKLSNTTSLKRHLSTVHKISENSTTTAQTRRQFFQAESTKLKEMTKALTLLLTVGLQPVNIVEEPAFQFYTYVAESRYEIPSAKSFLTEIIPTLFDTESNKLKHKVTTDFRQDNNAQLVLSANGFSTRKILSQISLTLHYITAEFKIQRIMLNVKKLPESASQESVYDFITETLSDWNIVTAEKKNIYFVVEDSIIVKDEIASEETWERIPSLNGIIEQSVQNGIAQSDPFTDLCKKCQKLIKYFRQNPDENTKLSKLLSSEDTGFQIECNTDDFYTKLEMFRSLLKVRSALKRILKENSSSGNLTVSEWELLKIYIEVLESAEDTLASLTDFSLDKFPLLSCYFPLLIGFRSNVIPSSGECDLAISIEKELNKKIDNMKKIYAIEVAMILDPRFKDRLLENEHRRCAMSKLEKLIHEFKSSSSTRSESENGSREELPSGEPKSKMRKFLMKHFSAENSSREKASSMSITHEIAGYLKESTCDNENPLEWWSANQHRFPILKDLAKVFLAIPAVTESIELPPSIKALRSRIPEEDLSKIGFLHSNLNIPKF